MKISPYMNIDRIEFMVTYQCSGHCRHCSIGDRLNKPCSARSVSPQNASKVIEELSGSFPVSSVMTFGGEPLLYTETTCRIHEAASRCGINKRQLITNGYFTKDDKQRKHTAYSIKKAGVNELLISVDAFHQESIPVEAVYSFVKYAKEYDFHSIQIHPAWVVDENYNNPYNNKTKEIISAFGDLEIPVSKGNNIFMAGNAVEHLAHYYSEPHLDFSSSCGSMPYTEPLTNITSLSIVPVGDVMICGFVIGNINEENIHDIIGRYDPYQNEWMNAILTKGAAGLLELAVQKGIDVDPLQCYSVCDLCHKVNNKINNS